MNRELATEMGTVEFSFEKAETNHGKTTAELVRDAEQVAESSLAVLEIAATKVRPGVKERAQEIAKAVYRKTARMLKVFNMVAMMVALGAAIDYQATRYQVNQTSGEDGQEVYTHEDQETTHIINVLSGKDKLSYQEKLDFMKQNLAIQAEDLGVSVPGNWNDMNEEEIGQFFARTLLPKMGASQKEVEELANSASNWINKSELFPTDEQYNPKVYQALWKIEQESGSPKVRWLVYRVEREGDSSATQDLKQLSREHINPVTNTIYLNPIAYSYKEIVKDMIAEESHSKQFNENPIGTTAEFVNSSLGVLKTSITKGVPLYEAQSEEYDTEGSFEHNAHSRIQPQLEREYKDITGQDLRGKNEIASTLDK